MAISAPILCAPPFLAEKTERLLAFAFCLSVMLAHAFMDRVAEAYIGKAVFQSEILMLAGSSFLAGTGLMLAGAPRVGAPWTEVSGWHVALMGGLGLGVYAILCIAGKLHTSQPIGQSISIRIGARLLVLAVGFRIAPDFGFEYPAPISVCQSSVGLAHF